jgi:hypothetical protein
MQIRPARQTSNILVGGTMAFKSLLDPSFTYRNAASTDVRLTFERIRRELREKRRQAEQQEVHGMAVRNSSRPVDEPRVGT